MITHIITPEELAEMLIDDRPISPDGNQRNTAYTHQLKDGSLDKNHYVNLCLKAIPDLLTLFPVYPGVFRFINWINNSEIFTNEIGLSLVDFLEKKWTEEAYPNRINERAMVISTIISQVKHIITFERIKEISPKACEKDPWWLNRILYEYDPVEALEKLPEMPIADIETKMIFNIPMYLENFTKDELKEKIGALKIPSSKRSSILRLLNSYHKTKS